MKNIKELGLELIELEDEVLLVDRSKISIGNYITDNLRVWKWNDDCSLLGRKKVIASTKQLEGLPLLVIEDEVEEIVESYFNIKETRWKKALWKDGFKTARETYKYTEQDIWYIVDLFLKKVPDAINIRKEIENLTNKELWIEVESHCFVCDKDYDKSNRCKQLKGEASICLLRLNSMPKITDGKIKAIWK